MKCFNFFLVLLLILNYQSYSQNQKIIDSLTLSLKIRPNDTLKVGAYGTLHELLMFSDPELALDYANEALVLSKTLNYNKGISSSNLQIGNFYYNKSEVDSAKYYYNKGLKIAKDNAIVISQIFANHSLASIEKDAGNYDLAIDIVMRNIDLYNKEENLKTLHNKIPFNLIGAEYELLSLIHLSKGNNLIALKECLKALDFFKKINDEIRQADALKQLGNIEYALGNYNSSLTYFNEALDIYKKNNDLFYQSSTANQIGLAYIQLKDYKKAETSFKEALAIAKKTESTKDQADSMRGLGKVALYEKQFKDAEDYFQTALEKYQSINFNNDVAKTLSLLSQVAVSNNNWNSSLQYINKSITINENIGATSNLKDNYFQRSILYEQLNNTQSALEDLKKYQVINDSINSKEKTQQIEELRTIYETEKKEQQIQIQKNEIDLLNLKGKTNNLQRLLLALGLLLALIAVYAFYLRNKRNKLAKEAAQAELEFKTKELTTHALHLAKKNEVLNDLKQKAKVLKQDADADPGYQMLIQTINFDLQDDNNWENFSRYFEEVHKDFNSKAQQQFPNITTNDLRLMALLKMNLSSKEIANILNISSDGIKKARQRLRKKMGIDSNQSLEAIVIAI
ncbi:tetratricopeptide repeat protein [Olleya sp. YS]|uniref:tetratricopeptide repeat protein n=1 Tax=Olleya sp. YS TaxID=3028318 RepID=UPI002434298B|nr:tetratricopeptide repeat protein [Olleya sp. YS]WGD34046.1 tetratricopeptide repeat protein [Olleya sp. YS]